MQFLALRIYYYPHYVYVIFSEKLNRKYIGYTTNLKERFKEHNLGKSNFTSKGVPWKLIYYEAFLLENDTRREEIFLKSGKGRERMTNLFK